MQAITHFTVGIIIQILFYKILFPIGLILTIILSFFSHFLVDAVTKITYHPSEPKKEDKFWVTYHAVIIPAAIVVLIWFWNPFWLAMVCATLVDIWDWGVLRGIYYLKKDPDWFHPKRFRIHTIIDKFRNKIFYWLPDWNEKKYGIIPEIILNFVLLFFIIMTAYFW